MLHFLHKHCTVSMRTGFSQSLQLPTFLFNLYSIKEYISFLFYLSYSLSVLKSSLNPPLKNTPSKYIILCVLTPAVNSLQCLLVQTSYRTKSKRVFLLSCFQKTCPEIFYFNSFNFIFYPFRYFISSYICV